MNVFIFFHFFKGRLLFYSPGPDLLYRQDLTWNHRNPSASASRTLVILIIISSISLLSSLNWDFKSWLPLLVILIIISSISNYGTGSILFESTLKEQCSRTVYVGGHWCVQAYVGGQRTTCWNWFSAFTSLNYHNFSRCLYPLSNPIGTENILAIVWIYYSFAQLSTEFFLLQMYGSVSPKILAKL